MPTPQKGQTHANNSLSTGDKLFEYVSPFFGVGAERLNKKEKCGSHTQVM